jgi:LacI family transcriptional regulator
MKKPLHIMIAQVWSLGLAHEIGKGVLEYAQTHGRWKCSRPDFSQAQHEIESWHSDGLILGGPIKDESGNLKAVNCPYVITQWVPSCPGIMQVDTDPADTGRMAAEHLLAGSGYKNAAVCFCPESEASTARAQGFSERARESGIEPGIFKTNPLRIPPDSLADWLEPVQKPVAVFCCDDVIAQDVIRLIQDMKMDIPEEVAVLGCEDNELICEGSNPSISSVHLPYRKVGYEAARMLDHAIRNRHLKRKQLYLPPEGITARMSTGIFATEDVQLRRALEFIRRHAGENITVHDAARHAGLSLRTMQNRFKEEVGRSPVEEIQRARMAKVKELLRNTEMTLNEIAEVSGFQSGHYLSRHFKAVNRRSTRNYRNEFRRT